MPLKILLGDEPSLTRLAVHGARWSTPRADITLHFRALSSSETARWQRRLERLYNQCGCAAGAVALILCLVVVAVLIWTGWDQGARLNALFVAAAGLGVVASVPAGKALGLLWARLHLRRAVTQLQNIIASREVSNGNR